MYNITDDKIKSMCCSDDVFSRGMKYYRDGRIKNVDIDNDRGCVYAVVSGSRDYYVELEFSPEGNIMSAECSCPAYYEYGGCCKHIAAMFLYLKDIESSRVQVQGGRVLDFRSIKPAIDIINFFENRLNAITSEPIDLEVTLDIFYEGAYGRVIRPAISIRMGNKKLYVVKSIKNLIKSIDSGSILEFGKGFTFDPANSCFKEEDMPIIDFIKEMYDIERTMEGYSRYGYGGECLFKGKYLYLPHMSLGRFLKVMEKRPLKVSVMDKHFNNVEIVDEDMPVDFLLRKCEDDIVLDINIAQEVMPLTPDGRHMFLDGKIYNISKSQRENLAPFYKAILEMHSREIRFHGKACERFASLVMPNIKKAGCLTVDGSVEELFYQKPLEAKLYIDKEGSRITAHINFGYGEYIIDPFNDTLEAKTGNIIIRDYETERKILGVLERCGFNINNGIVHLDDDDKIYEFIVDYIPKLQEMCDIYYSDDFKKIRIIDSSYYRSSVRFNEESDMLEFSFSIDGTDRESIPEILTSLKQKKKYHRLPDGSFIPLNSKGLSSISNMMEYLDIKDEELEKKSINLPKSKAMYIDEHLKEFDSVYIERNIAFKKLVENIKEPKDIEYDLPENLKGIMRGYQITGFKWLKTLSSYGLGGILADDMGLGKTLEAIAFLLSEKEKLNLPSLVVCPTSLVYNWESEIQKFAPSLKTMVISGGKYTRDEQVKEIGGVDIVITSYPLMRKDIDNYRNILFGCCILDEAQHIKNPGSINARSVKEINAKGYFALTGTPIENNLTELWSIFDFVLPGYLLSHKKFIERFEKPILARENENIINELNRHVKPFILRRFKKDVLKELPSKIESVLTCELAPGQKKIYIAYLEQIKGRIEEEIREKGIEKSRIQILAGLTRLRQICCHPSLFMDNYDGGSSKMDLLMELFQELKEGGHRVLLFSQFTGALKLIRDNIESEGISYFYLDGSTKIHERIELVNSFNQGLKDVFLISMKAGGTGLNLTGADTVIHFDPWWNPAVEEQATDRAYRIGQQSTVQVMKLITKGTIEDKIYYLQKKKKKLIDSVLETGESFISGMSEEDIKNLFKIS